MAHTSHPDNDQLYTYRFKSGNEDINIFFDEFGKSHKALIDRLKTLEDSNDESSNSIVVLHEETKKTRELQTELTAATIFLPDSLIQLYQSKINELFATIDRIRVKTSRRKKFTFSSRLREEAEKRIEPVAVNPIDKIKRIVDWTVSDRTNEIVIVEGIECNQKDITMSNLTNCIVRIIGHPGSVQLANLTNCLVLSGPCHYAVYGDNIQNTIIAVLCQQFRLHNSHDVTAYLHVTSRAIIENCTDFRVAPYTFEYDTLANDLSELRQDLMKNNYADVADFDWLVGKQDSPNWRLLCADETVTNWPQFIADYQLKHVGH